ncbi:hypothetical protein [Caulobacter sp. NIBR1757]|uniref:hypothetical protein n=1 Tax=Caulobacter sp. NIBR1757 TaxID=3016000 RepID=UPI0022F0D368|nr:hypothetical protein [Caulobacter sp. NIBR1757]WGM37860.1 hypothetical protein AMEJIAPC_00760 [Caulobacter sp. NIBR1757]
MARKPTAKANPGAHGTPLLEWIAGAVGLVLVLMTLAVIGHEAVFGDTSPPAVTVETREIHAVKGGWLVEIEAINSGGSPAAQVAVEGELTLPGQPPETAEASFDYVPDQSRRRGGLFFTADPRGGRLSLRARGYTEP